MTRKPRRTATPTLFDLEPADVPQKPKPKPRRCDKAETSPKPKPPKQSPLLLDVSEDGPPTGIEGLITRIEQDPRHWAYRDLTAERICQAYEWYRVRPEHRRLTERIEAAIVTVIRTRRKALWMTVGPWRYRIDPDTGDLYRSAEPSRKKDLR